MKWWRFIFLMIIITVLQASTVMNLISLTDLKIKPNFLLILLVYFAINCDSYDAVITSFAIGFAADIVGMIIGPHFISYGLVGSAIAHIRKVILLKETRYQALTIFVSAILVESIAFLLSLLKAPELVEFRLGEIIAVGIYSAIILFLIKWPVSKLGNWLGLGIHRFGIRMIER